MNNKKIFLITVISLVTVLLISLTIYKFVYYKEPTNKDTNKVISKDHYFIKNEILEMKKNSTNSEKDKDIYSENIITNIVKTTDYNYFSTGGSISGKIYIGEDKYIYITENNSNVTYRVSTTKFKTIYVNDFDYSNGIYIALLSEDNKIYCMALSGNDITKAEVVPAYTSLTGVTNFVNINLDSDMYGDGNTIFVLTQDGNIYDVASGIRYNKDIISLYNKLFVFKDASMTNMWGEQIQDKNKQNYKIKYIFYTKGDSNFVEKNTIIVVTEDDRLIYFDKDIYNVYEFNKKVKNIKFNKNMPYVEGNLEITFEDNYKVNLKVSSNEYFALNKIELNLD